ncbi:MAG: Mur ligase family protein [Pseudomonadota bacterium]
MTKQEDKLASEQVQPQEGDALESWLAYVSSVHWKNWDLGLDRMHEMVQRMNLASPAPLVITVAGTNGKGSTCIAMEAGLSAGGLTVACTLSPHIVRFNERFRINGVEASDAEIVAALEVVEHARADLSLSYFEFSTLAFLWFAQSKGVDAVILEIGLGGRLDAFNAVDADIAVITSIDFDHEQYLGDTLNKIGAEKAGILRAGQHAVFGPDLPESVFLRANELHLNPVQYGHDFAVSKVGECTLEFSFGPELNPHVIRAWGNGNIAPQNISVAAAALQGVEQACARFHLSDETLAAMCNAYIRGRFDLVEALDRCWILDVAHNEQGAQFLLQRVQEQGLEIKAVMCGMLVDKHHHDFIKLLSSAIDGPWVFLDTLGERGHPGAELLASAPSGVQGCVVSDMQQGVAEVLSCTDAQDVILCAGSFNLIEQFHNHVLS